MTPSARVIDETGTNIGVMKTVEAIRLAAEKGLDLVEVSKGSDISVCKIQDYNKFLYEQNSKQKKTKAKKSELKEFIFGPHIGEGDIRIRIDRGRKFIEDGDMVKYTIKFQGRQAAYPEIGMTKLKIIESELADIARTEGPIKHVGKFMSITFVAK